MFYDIPKLLVLTKKSIDTLCAAGTTAGGALVGTWGCTKGNGNSGGNCSVGDYDTDCWNGNAAAGTSDSACYAGTDPTTQYACVNGPTDQQDTGNFVCETGLGNSSSSCNSGFIPS